MLISERTYASSAQTPLNHVGTYQQTSGHGLQMPSPHGKQRQVILHGPGQQEKTCTSQK